jgi:hypothetical protein
MHLDKLRIGRQTALIDACIRMTSTMFKITQNTIQLFSLEEVLLMAAMNEVEGKRNAASHSPQARAQRIGDGR